MLTWPPGLGGQAAQDGVEEALALGPAPASIKSAEERLVLVGTEGRAEPVTLDVAVSHASILIFTHTHKSDNKLHTTRIFTKVSYTLHCSALRNIVTFFFLAKSGGWSSWGSWSSCSVTSTFGRRSCAKKGYRQCNNPRPSCGGNCYGSSSKTSVCSGLFVKGGRCVCPNYYAKVGDKCFYIGWNMNMNSWNIIIYVQIAEANVLS